MESIAAGESLNSISQSMGISRSTLREWRDAPGDIVARVSDCPRCHPSLLQVPSESYAHLLGLYLGDGCVSALKKGVYSLRITCDDKYPRLIDEVAAAIKAVHPSRPVYRVQKIGCTDVQSSWKHWPCLFPQYGVGAKHTRKIELADWQAEIVRQHPGLFLRGLFNSDGCRITNCTTRPVGGEMKRFEHPRYFSPTHQRTSSACAPGRSTCWTSPGAGRTGSRCPWLGVTPWRSWTNSSDRSPSCSR